MAYLSEHCVFSPLTEDLISSLSGIECEQAPDIAAFFRDEAVLNERQRLSKSYCFYRKDTMEIVCAFCVSNSSISMRTMPTDTKSDFTADIPDDKRRSFYPATLIGQLAIFDGFRDKHIRDEFLNLIKVWIATEASQIGFRYLVVDAINSPKVLDFYSRNGFETLFDDEQTEKEYRGLHGRKPLRTRFMTYNLTLMKL